MKIPKFDAATIERGLNWILTISNKLDGAMPDVAKERLPGFLGLSLEDERLFNGKLGQLGTQERRKVTSFLNACHDYERNRFRNIVAGITGTVKINDNEVDQGVLFLRQLAAVITDNDFVEARRQCFTGNVFVNDPISQKILKRWTSSVVWFKKTVLDFFEVDELSKITPALFNEKAEELAEKVEKMTEKIPEPRQKSFIQIFFAPELSIFNFLKNKIKK